MIQRILGLFLGVFFLAGCGGLFDIFSDGSGDPDTSDPVEEDTIGSSILEHSTDVPDGNPKDLVYGNGFLWLLGAEENLLYKLDLDGNVLEEIDPGFNLTWSWSYYRNYSYGIDYRDGRIYIVDESDRTRILVYDPDTGTSEELLDVKEDFSCQGFTQDDEGNRIYIKTTHLNLSVNNWYLVMYDSAGGKLIEEETDFHSGLDYFNGTYCCLYDDYSGNQVCLFKLENKEPTDMKYFEGPSASLLAVTSDGEGTFWAFDEMKLYRFTLE